MGNVAALKREGDSAVAAVREQRGRGAVAGRGRPLHAELYRRSDRHGEPARRSPHAFGDENRSAADARHHPGPLGYARRAGRARRLSCATCGMRAPIGTKRAAHPSRRVPAPRPHQPDHDLTLSAEQAPPEGAARRQLAGPGAGRRSRSSEQRSIIRNSGSNPWRQVR